MTEPTRIRLERTALETLARLRLSSSITERAEAVVDAILDELMEPGEGVLPPPSELVFFDFHRDDDAKGIWQSVINRIKAGK